MFVEQKIKFSSLSKNYRFLFRNKNKVPVINFAIIPIGLIGFGYFFGKLKELTRWCWECHNAGYWGGWGVAAGAQCSGCGGGVCECGACLGHMGIEGCPHTCRGLKWCIVVMGGKPMVGATAGHGLTSLFPPPPPVAVTPYSCLLWFQLAASASRASKCFLWDLYFCTHHHHYNFMHDISSK